MKSYSIISVFLKEQKRYMQSELIEIFGISKEKTIKMLKRLKEYGILKNVKKLNIQKELTELYNEDETIVDIDNESGEYLYVFTFVGVIVVEGIILKIFPKYIFSTKEPVTELKQILNVISYYNKKEQLIKLENSISDKNTSYNRLSIILYLLNDYYEYGIYNNYHIVTEINGNGDILWNKTISKNFPLILNECPYYLELVTRKKINDKTDYLKMLHECILTICSKELENSNLLDLFNISRVDLSNRNLSDFGDKMYILDRIEKELNVQFNTRKQVLLKALYNFVSYEGSVIDAENFSLYGTNNFNLVWEKVCSTILENQLNNFLKDISLPVTLKEEYKKIEKLKDIIEKPKWLGKSMKNYKVAQKTLIPDLISIYKKNDNEYQFVIFDAKYYNLVLETDRKLEGYPGIESVVKQFLYQLAYKQFLFDHKFDNKNIKNCFLMPIEGDEIIDKGEVWMNILSGLGLEKIQIRLLPAKKIYDMFLKEKKLDIEDLKL